MADVRTFRAASMQQALDIVRDELGDDAVILHTRHVDRKRMLPWLKPIEEVEITASPTVKAASAHTAHLKAERRAAAQTVTTPQATTHVDLVSEGEESIATLLEPRPAARAEQRTPVRRSISSPTFERPAAPTNRFAGSSLHAQDFEPSDHDPTAMLASRLDAIQQLLIDLGRRSPELPRSDVPTEMFGLYTELIDAELEESVARDLVQKLSRSISPKQRADRETCRAKLAAMVESEIACHEPIVASRGRRKVIALVGATGVGKTTTIAKLAATLRIRSGIRVGLVTVDTYRVAAVEQLKTYAEIIDLPMKVVTTPHEMRRALDDLAGLDVVLIDTAGRSPRDAAQIHELRALLAEARVDEVHLVLSMTAGLSSLKAAAAQFSAAGTTALILTKLDEASGMGALLSVARAIRLPISYLTMGQEVPDDLEPAHPARIARLILGEERMGR